MLLLNKLLTNSILTMSAYFNLKYLIFIHIRLNYGVKIWLNYTHNFTSLSHVPLIHMTTNRITHLLLTARARDGGYAHEMARRVISRMGQAGDSNE